MSFTICKKKTNNHRLMASFSMQNSNVTIVEEFIEVTHIYIYIYIYVIIIYEQHIKEFWKDIFDTHHAIAIEFLVHLSCTNAWHKLE
jgi:hypothetical protein